ncbi:MAG: hypothetical protein EXR53_03475 [Dehalococcoidia bacterium]|nr:hypothetical protein [Dehalococcoidia bacterium]
MPEPPTILELIRNGTMSAEMAATLWAAVDQRISFVTVAIPRLAGKTTTTNAMLALLPPDVPVHRLSGDEAEMVRLKKAATGGYLVVGEFAQAPVPTYIWGAPVRRVFDTLTAGYSLAVALHAPSLQETFDAICLGNGVTDEQASRIGMMLYIRRFGEDPSSFWRRLSEVHEIDHVQAGRPAGCLLYRWVERGDRFEAVNAPRKVSASPAELAARTASLKDMVAARRTTAADVARMVAEYHRSS